MSAAEDAFPAPVDDPYTRFAAWFEAAQTSDEPEPAAMTVASIDDDGFPDARVVLLRGWSAEGLVFYTNLESDKGQQLLANGRVALCFLWKSLGRQLRVQGTATRVDDDVADAYWASRPKQSRLHAIASQQSRPLGSRDELLARVDALEAEYATTDDVPRPAHWSGLSVRPHRYEFWQEGEFRLHTRERYRLEGGAWARALLQP